MTMRLCSGLSGQLTSACWTGGSWWCEQSHGGLSFPRTLNTNSLKAGLSLDPSSSILLHSQSSGQEGSEPASAFQCGVKGLPSAGLQDARHSEGQGKALG